MMPEQEERQVKALEAIADALTKMANPVMVLPVGPLAVPGDTIPTGDHPTVTVTPRDLLGVTGKITATGDHEAMGMKVL